MDFIDLAQHCAPTIHIETMRALVNVESSFNPFAIGVVNGKLERQPRNQEEAVATANELERNGYNYSVGYAQVNKHNFKKYGLTVETAFDHCSNLRAGAGILQGCFDSAKMKFKADQDALRAAFSCYYSGNFQTGFKPDFKGQPSYVDKIVGSALGIKGSVPQVNKVQAIRVIGAPKSVRSVPKEAPAPRAAGAATQPSEQTTASDSGPKSALIF